MRRDEWPDTVPEPEPLRTDLARGRWRYWAVRIGSQFKPRLGPAPAEYQAVTNWVELNQADDQAAPGA